MSKVCKKCGARLKEGMKLCPNCGRVVPAAKKQPDSRQRSRAYEPPASRSERYDTPRGKRRYPREEAYAEPCMARAEEPEHEESRPHIGRRLVFSVIKIGLILLIIYCVAAAVQVFRVKRAGYDFDTPMEMSHASYGEAIDEFFDSGKWGYDPFSFTVTYSGEHGGEEYRLAFHAVGKIDVKYIQIDGKTVDEDKIETVVMGMFI